MSRQLLAISVTLAVVSSGFAHDLFLLPPAADGPLTMVFHTGPTVDGTASVAPLGVKQLGVVSKTGAVAVREVVPGDRPTLAVRTGDAVVFGSAEYGIVNRGEGHVYRLRFHAKAVLTAGADTAVGQPLELAAKTTADGTAFVATADGKPLGSHEVAVFEPGGTTPMVVKTDAAGVTPTFTKPGRYAVRVSRFDKTPGEHDGRAYTGVYHYSTLVVTTVPRK